MAPRHGAVSSPLNLLLPPDGTTGRMGVMGFHPGTSDESPIPPAARFCCHFGRAHKKLQPTAHMDPDTVSTLTADEALQRLKAGNDRFMAGTARFPTVQKEILADLAKGQNPYATILACSDSRV